MQNSTSSSSIRLLVSLKVPEIFQPNDNHLAFNFELGFLALVLLRKKQLESGIIFLPCIILMYVPHKTVWRFSDNYPASSHSHCHSLENIGTLHRYSNSSIFHYFNFSEIHFLSKLPFAVVEVIRVRIRIDLISLSPEKEFRLPLKLEIPVFISSLPAVWSVREWNYLENREQNIEEISLPLLPPK